MGKVRKSMP
jgi:hypothetical protein